jgi:hypothetical protein
MKKMITPLGSFLMIMLLNSCSAIGSIFKAGSVFGVVLVISVIILIAWVFSLLRRKK